MTRDDPVQRLARRVRQYRESAGYTQQELAALAGLSVSLVRDLEQGRTTRPHQRSVEHLAAALCIGEHEREALLTMRTEAAPAGQVPGPDAAGQVRGPDAAGQDRPAGGAAGGTTFSGLRLGLLGPLTAWRDGTPVPLGTGRERAVLGLLGLHLEAGLHRDAIVDVLWAENPPKSAVVIVQAQVSRLRQRLDPGQPARPATRILVSEGTRYRLRPGVGCDAGEFAQRAEQGRAAAAAGRPTEACEHYEAALQLWRGEPLADVDILAGHPAVVELACQRAGVIMSYAEAATAAGWPDRAVDHLRALAGREPLNERAVALYMIALTATGQRAAALELFAELRERLATELGVSPGPELADAHLRVLRDLEPISPAPPAGASHAVPASGHAAPSAGSAGPVADQDAPAAGQGAAAGRGAAAGQGAASGRGAAAGQGAPASGPAGLVPMPRQLPAALPHFVGRAVEFAALNAILDQAPFAGGTVVIAAIDGAAGVGKSALAVYWAHQVAARFPDGQLHVNLAGYGPAETPMSPQMAIRRLLESLGVPGERIPADLNTLVALYRSTLAGRRMLIVLDNARGPEQVRPLLPGEQDCLVLVTSRHQLTGLAVANGAHLLTLDVLAEEEARELLARRMGQGRAAAEPAAVTELSELCARLPLALSVAAARAAARPGLPLAALVAELRDAQARLDGLGTGDAATDVRTVFSWSYQQVSDLAAQMFRLIGVHSGPDLTVPAAASLSGLTAGEARRALTELIHAYLITEPAPGRYTCHDLLRAYAAELALGEESDASRRAAVRRVLDHYLHTAFLASRLLHPYRDPIALGPAEPGVSPEQLADRPQALAWFRAERRVLLAVIRQAAGAGFEEHAWQLPWTLATFFSWQGYWNELETTQRAALTAARRLGDRAAQAQARHYLGQALFRLAVYDESSVHLTEMLELGRQLGSSATQALAHIELARICDLESRRPAALSHVEQALALFRAAGHRSGEADALNAAGWCHAQLGSYQEAIGFCTQSLRAYRALDHRAGEAVTLDSLGYIHYQLGQYAEAIAHCQQAIDTFAEADDRGERAQILIHLGDAQQAAGDTAAARQTWKLALGILDGLQDPAAARVREKLGTPGSGSPGRRITAALAPQPKVDSPARPKAGHRLARSGRRRAGGI